MKDGVCGHVVCLCQYHSSPMKGVNDIVKGLSGFINYWDDLCRADRVSNFPIILTKITLEHNKMTLKIEPTRSCEVANSNKEINPIKPFNSTFRFYL